MGSMKTYSLILSVFILINSMNDSLIAADKNAPKKNEVYSGIVVNNSLKKLMDIDGVQPIYAACQRSNTDKSPNFDTKVIECLWTGVKKDPKLKKMVQEVYSQELKGAKTTSDGRSPATATTTPLTTTANAVVSTDYGSDPAITALSDFYGKKLDAILNPEVALTAEEKKNNVILAVNHRQFIDLYKSELGKTIVGSFTSYCLDTDPKTCFCDAKLLAECTEKDKSKCSCAKCEISSDSKVRAEHRDLNVKSLKMADLKTGSGDSEKWTMCIQSVTNSCKTQTGTLTNQSETTKRSCLVMDYVSAARKNIIYADKQIDFYDEMAKDQTQHTAQNMKEITDLKKTSSDTLLEMSSTDVKLTLEKPIIDKLKDLEGCYKDNVIVNVNACKKYLNTNSQENEMGLAELGMRQIAQEGLLEEELGSDQKVKAYLKEEGYTSEQIKTMTADKEGIADIKTQILDRYKNQKNAIIKEMASRIADKTAVTEGVITPTGDPLKSNDISKLEKIKTELQSRSTDLQNLVYFNNVVSSYLEIDDGKGKITRNTASLFSEANSLEKEQAELMKEQIKSANLKDQKGSANTTNLDVDTINSNFLNYGLKEKKK